MNNSKLLEFADKPFGIGNLGISLDSNLSSKLYNYGLANTTPR